MQQLDAPVAAAAGNKEALTLLMRALRLGNDIFYSLNVFGLSETVEAQMEGWMKSWHQWLQFTDPCLKESDTDVESAECAPHSTPH